MAKEYIDKRVLRILRWSLVLQVFLLFQTSVSPGIFRLSPDGRPPRVNWIALIPIAVVIIILLLLSIKKIESRVTKSQLLVILYVIALLTILSRDFATSGAIGGGHIKLPKTDPSPLISFFRGGWETIFFLIIPLVFIAWQYSMREVIFYSFVTTLFETIPSLIFPPAEGYPIFFVLNFFSDIMRSFIMLIVGWIQNQLVKVQREQHQQLLDANKKLRNFALTSEKLAQTQERNRLARELHDTLAHTLSSVSVQLEAVKALFDKNPDQAKIMLNDTLSNTKNGLKETRRTLVDLRSSELESYGLSQALRNLGNASAERGGFEISIMIDNNMDILADDVSHCIFRTAQEALENVLRHASAQQVTVKLISQNNQIILTISDDGFGFNEVEVSKDHLGIQGMRERVEMLGGSFTIKSEADTGTTISAILEKTNDKINSY